jgi:hypothetical protein
MKQPLINALRKGTDVILDQFGTLITLTPHLRVKKPGGVYDWEPQTPRDPQVFNIEPVNATLQGLTGASGGITNLEGAKAHKWAYTLTGRYDSLVEIGDTWKNGETEYRVTALNPYNFYEKTAVVEAIGKDPAYGS